MSKCQKVINPITCCGWMYPPGTCKLTPVNTPATCCVALCIDIVSWCWMAQVFPLFPFIVCSYFTVFTFPLAWKTNKYTKLKMYSNKSLGFHVFCISHALKTENIHSKTLSCIQECVKDIVSHLKWLRKHKKCVDRHITHYLCVWVCNVYPYCQTH